MCGDPDEVAVVGKNWYILIESVYSYAYKNSKIVSPFLKH